MNKEQAKELCRQIGVMNIGAISGGRMALQDGKLVFPVSSGYRVVITLEPSDTYTVERIMIRGTKVFHKGKQTDVYCTEIGEVAYVASCYKNREFGEE